MGLLRRSNNWHLFNVVLVFLFYFLKQIKLKIIISFQSVLFSKIFKPLIFWNLTIYLNQNYQQLMQIFTIFFKCLFSLCGVNYFFWWTYKNEAMKINLVLVWSCQAHRQGRVHGLWIHSKSFLTYYQKIRWHCNIQYKHKNYKLY